MKNKWSDEEAQSIVNLYEDEKICRDLALRVYTSRLIGREPELVIHGGGNTSVKTKLPDFLGHEHNVLCVKGSGWDLGTIEPQGLPALYLDPLQEIRDRETLSDEDMVAFLRSNLLEANSPNPSVETLLHAFLPHKYVDHSHATAILAVSDLRNGFDICREIFGERLAYLPYVMPGFKLAKATADAFDLQPGVEGVLLHKHGLFTFGDDAKSSYARMIDFVSLAEDYINSSPKKTTKRPSNVKPGGLAVSDIASIVRGACATPLGGGDYRRFVSVFRTSDRIREYVDGADVSNYSQRGVVTPDHIIRTKNKPLLTTVPGLVEIGSFRKSVRQSAEEYRKQYKAYFEKNNLRVGENKVMLDPSPRVVLVPRVGLFGLGLSVKEASVVADLAEITIDTILKAEQIGTYEALSEEELFEMEYWSLEQAKLGKEQEKPLAGQVAVVTGGGGTIGAATAKLFAENGAELAILDRDGRAALEVARDIGGHALAIECDVTDQNSIAAAFADICSRFGGVDILVSNAGAAWEGEIATLEDEVLRKSFELNFFAHQNLAKAAVAIMKLQQTGGVLLFNASKQAVNPGANFGAYGLPKAATLFLSRQYALEYGQIGIRSNAVNADRVRSGLLTDDMIKNRASVRGLTEEDYLQGNLLGLEVRAEDVARAFLDQALALRTTGGVTTVDGGNIAAALR